jgi:hypothetical protein
MKISHDTLTVLKNFASINGNIFIREGNILATVSAGKNILARTTISESFPKDVAIYDLNSLLGLLTLMEEQDVEFNEASLRISKDGSEFEYYYSDPGVVTSAPDKELEIDPVYTFTLTAEQISMIQRAASIVSAPTISLVSSGGQVTLKVGDPANAASNSYKKVIGTADIDFDARLKVENLKVIPDTYEVSLGRKKAMRLKSTSRDLVYFLAMEPSSTM